MKLGITGASGQLGTLLVRHALQRTAASNLVAITRNPEKLEPFTKQGVEPRGGDFTQPEGLDVAFKGIEKLVIVPTSDLTPGARTRQHDDAIDAAVKAGVEHIIYISTVSPRPDANNALLNSHFTTEQKLFNTDVKWTLLRMAIYAETLVDNAKRAVAAGAYSAVPGAPAAYVRREDIAAAAAGILTTKGHVGMTYHATGPVAVTQPQIAEALSKAAGKPVPFVEMTGEAQRQALEAALPAFLVPSVFGFQEALRAGAFDLVTGDVARLAGQPAVSVLDFISSAI